VKAYPGASKLISPKSGPILNMRSHLYFLKRIKRVSPLKNPLLKDRPPPGNFKNPGGRIPQIKNASAPLKRNGGRTL